MRPIMNLHVALLVFLLAHAAPTDAGLFARSTESLARAANRLHHRAAKRSAGLAKDLRRAFSGMYPQELAATGNGQRVYCVNTGGTSLTGGANDTSSSDGSSDSSSSNSNGTSSASSSGAASSGTKSASSTASSPSSTSGATSPWKLAKSYVRPHLFGASAFA